METTAKITAGGVAVLIAALTGLASGCSGDGGPVPDQTVVRVFAAASLTESFAELEVAFEAEHPTIDIELNLAGSSSLRAQILAGAPADVFASANQVVMSQVIADAQADGPPRDFATNSLTIAVPEGNPANVSGIDDFANPELFVGLCASEVPCGSLADEVLAQANVTPSLDTREPDVRALLNKVATGELDAGIVYETEVLAAAEQIDAIALPARSAAVTTYPIVVLTGGQSPDEARLFVSFVLSAAGADILAENGFGLP